MSEIPSGGFWPSVTRGALPKESPELPADVLPSVDPNDGDSDVDPNAAGSQFSSLLSSLTNPRPIVVVTPSSGGGTNPESKDSVAEATSPVIGDDAAANAPGGESAALGSSVVKSGRVGAAAQASLPGTSALTPIAVAAPVSAHLSMPGSIDAAEQPNTRQSTSTAASATTESSTAASGVQLAAETAPMSAGAQAMADTRSATAQTVTPGRLAVSTPSQSVSARFEAQGGVVRLVAVGSELRVGAQGTGAASTTAPALGETPLPAATEAPASVGNASVSKSAEQTSRQIAGAAATNASDVPASPSTLRDDVPRASAPRNAAPRPAGTREEAPAGSTIADPASADRATPTNTSSLGHEATAVRGEFNLDATQASAPITPRDAAPSSGENARSLLAPSELLPHVVAYGEIDSLALSIDATLSPLQAEVPAFVPTESWPATYLVRETGEANPADGVKISAGAGAGATAPRFAPTVDAAVATPTVPPSAEPSTASRLSSDPAGLGAVAGEVKTADLFHWAEAEAQGAPIRLSELLLSPAPRVSREPETVAIVRVPESLAKLSSNEESQSSGSGAEASGNPAASPSMQPEVGASATESAAPSALPGADAENVTRNPVGADPGSTMPSLNAFGEASDALATSAASVESSRSESTSADAPVRLMSTVELAPSGENAPAPSRHAVSSAASSDVDEHNLSSSSESHPAPELARAPRFGEPVELAPQSDRSSEPVNRSEHSEAAVSAETAQAQRNDSPAATRSASDQEGAREATSEGTPRVSRAAPSAISERTPTGNRTPRVTSPAAAIENQAAASGSGAMQSTDAPSATTSAAQTSRNSSVSSDASSPSRPTAAPASDLIRTASPTQATSKDVAAQSAPPADTKESGASRDAASPQQLVPSPVDSTNRDAATGSVARANAGDSSPARANAPTPSQASSGLASGVSAPDGSAVVGDPVATTPRRGTREAQPRTQAAPRAEELAGQPRRVEAADAQTAASAREQATSQGAKPGAPAGAKPTSSVGAAQSAAISGGTVRAEATPQPDTKSPTRPAAKQSIVSAPAETDTAPTTARTDGAKATAIGDKPSAPDSAPAPVSLESDRASSAVKGGAGHPAVNHRASAEGAASELPAGAEESPRGSTSPSAPAQGAPIAEARPTQAPEENLAAPDPATSRATTTSGPMDRLDAAAVGANANSVNPTTNEPAPAATRAATTVITPRELPERFPSVVRLALDEGRREARIQLMPPDLGAIQVHLRVNGRAVHATMTVEREEVRALVEGLRKELSDQMEKSGLKLERLEVAASLVPTTFDPNVVSAPSAQAPTTQGHSNGANGERRADGESNSARRERGDGRMPEAMPPEKREHRRENSRGVDVRV